MHILIGIVLGVALLYFWLVGHWFARVLTFLIVVSLFFIFSIGFFGTAGLLGFVRIPVSIGVAWLISSGPTWYWRDRMRTIAAAETRSLHPAG